MDKLTINLDETRHLYLEGEKLAIEPKSEQALLKLIYIKLLAEDYIEKIKKSLVDDANKIMPKFKGFIGDAVKGTYRAYGSKYKYIDDGKSEPDPRFVSVKKSFVIDSEAVDKYFEETGKLPDGIVENDRTEQLSFNESHIKELFDDGKLLEKIENLDRLLESGK